MLLSGVCPKHLFRTSDLPFYSNLKRMFYIYSTRNILVHSFPASCAAVYGAALPESEFDFKKLNLYYVQLDLDHTNLNLIRHSHVDCPNFGRP